jgi:catechol 2,3-dioxygenase-like lactoylglutathione lyase family enzyme
MDRHEGVRVKRLDHVVLWTRDPRAAMDFYTRVVGLEPVRFAEFERNEAPFPSVRVCEDAIIDLLPVGDAAATESATNVAGSAGHPVNHVCLAMSKPEYEALDRRLRAAGVDTSARLDRTYGARGWAPQGYYFADPDGNVVEARYYE